MIFPTVIRSISFPDMLEVQFRIFSYREKNDHVFLVGVVYGKATEL
jgi:hypothetical protein